MEPLAPRLTSIEKIEQLALELRDADTDDPEMTMMVESAKMFLPLALRKLKGQSPETVDHYIDRAITFLGSLRSDPEPVADHEVVA